MRPLFPEPSLFCPESVSQGPGRVSKGPVGELDVAVLTSGGVESAVLVDRLSKLCASVVPIYVRFGHHWESAELRHLQIYLKAIAGPKLAKLVILDMPISDLYPDHWSTTGNGVPGADTPDEAVFLPGRNILLTAKVAVWCALNNVSAIAHGTLSTNPFPDATGEFFTALEEAYSQALDTGIRLLRPFSKLHKYQVLELGRNLPLQLSFSCIQPVQSRYQTIHCGACNKCQERITAFADAQIEDRTQYFKSQTASGYGHLSQAAPPVLATI